MGSNRKCSPDTALRDINELIVLGVMRKTAAGGRSSAYELADRSSGNRAARSGIVQPLVFFAPSTKNGRPKAAV
jgi:hypothetical protein